MKSVSEMRHLEQFGIKPLTGEADALGFRILCDLNTFGVQVFKECFGIPCHCGSSEDIKHGLANNWNSGSIASVMLTGHDVVPLAAIGFYLQGKTVLITRDQHYQEHVYALDSNEELLLDSSDEEDIHYVLKRDETKFPCRSGECVFWEGDVCRIIRQKTNDGQRVQGTRNVHQMSGRVS